MPQPSCQCFIFQNPPEQKITLVGYWPRRELQRKERLPTKERQTELSDYARVRAAQSAAGKCCSLWERTAKPSARSSF